MTEQETPPQVPEREIEYRGRMIWVQMPAPEQILVWQRTLRRLQETDDQSWTGQAVMAALERLRMIIDSVILNQADKDWLDDEMLARRIQMKDTAELVNQALAAFAEPEPDNRAGRRAAAKKTTPAKKAAVRKAPAR